MKRRIYLVALSLSLLALVRCGESTPTDSQTGTPQKEPEVKEKVGKSFDGVNHYTKNDLDSLTYTYTQPHPHGLYYIYKHGAYTIDLLPAMPYFLVKQPAPSLKTLVPETMRWMALHRLDRVAISTAARPGKINEVDGGYELSLPISGSTHQLINALTVKYPDGYFALLTDNGVVQIYEADSPFLAADGIRVRHPNEEVLIEIQEVFSTQ